MFCPKCGNEVSEETVYCGICGQKLEAGPPSVSTESQTETVLDPPLPKMFCPKCGNPIPEENSVCPSCGWKADPPQTALVDTPVQQIQDRHSEDSEDRRKRKIFLFIAITATILFLIAVLVSGSGSAKIAGEWESDYGDTIEFNEDGTCDIDEYILSLVSGSLINDADDQMYDVKLGGKIEVSYTSGRSVRSVEIEYKLKGDTLTLGNMTFERES